MLLFFSCDVRSTKQLEDLYFGCERHFNDKVAKMNNLWNQVLKHKKAAKNKMQVKIFCNNAGVNQNPGWRTCIEIDAVSFPKQLWICSMEIW